MSMRARPKCGGRVALSLAVAAASKLFVSKQLYTTGTDFGGREVAGRRFLVAGCWSADKTDPPDLMARGGCSDFVFVPISLTDGN